MKRKRAPAGRKSRNEVATDSHPPNENSGRSLAELPRHVIFSILLRLPIRNIVACKCLCKEFLDTVSHPEFAKLHFRQVESYPMIRTSNPSHLSRLSYLIQLEHNEGFNLMIDDFSFDDDYAFKKGNHSFKMKLNTKFKLPVRNFELVSNGQEGSTAARNPPSSSKRTPCIKLKPKDHKYKIVNSCNGLLCLSEPSCNNPVAISNPVTGEFISLPEIKVSLESIVDKDNVDCGLGWSSVTNSYKVIRIFSKHTPDPKSGKLHYCGRAAEVLTVGMRSWKDIGSAPYLYKAAFPTCLNGAVHWFCLDYKKDSIVSFDIDKKQFQSLPVPYGKESLFGMGRVPNISMGVLDGCLCICDASYYSSIDVWVMKDYGIKKSWTKVYSIYTDDGSRWPVGLYLPLKSMSGGALLMFHYQKSALIYYDPNKFGFKYLKVQGIKSKFESIAHTPSFISLKDVFGDQVEVLTTHSRCAKLKFQGESRDFFLVETNRALEMDTCSDYDSDSSSGYSVSELFW